MNRYYVSLTLADGRRLGGAVFARDSYMAFREMMSRAGVTDQHPDPSKRFVSGSVTRQREDGDGF